MKMDVTRLEKLLNRSEGDTLDFKREQYRYAGAPPEDKGELLKDILAFANTPRAGGFQTGTRTPSW